MSPTRRKRSSKENARRSLRVAGYKSVGKRAELDLRNLTLIAGVNSSGKSSFMQPFLLLKQTLEAGFDAGAILVNGPNVQLTDWSQTLSKGKGRSKVVREFEIGISLEDNPDVTNYYEWSPDKGLELAATEYSSSAGSVRLTPSSSSDDVDHAIKLLDEGTWQFWESIQNDHPPRRKQSTSKRAEPSYRLEAAINRCFIEPHIARKVSASRWRPWSGSNIMQPYRELLRSIIHVPGLRGNPTRTYNYSSVSGNFVGTMELYVAGVISRWQNGSDAEKRKLKALSRDLERLGLTWKILARKINDASVELRVGRMPHAQQGGAQDLVNIVDVGFGVSQTLPVLIALHAARSGQVVYVEQPEIHLHPRAQAVLGELLVEAANRGVFVIVETHSSLVLRAVQTAVAQQVISYEDVSLNWFTRDPNSGQSRIEVADLDSYGRFGDWPVDFDEVTEQSEWSFVESVQRAAHDQ